MKNTSFIIISVLAIVAFTYCSSSKNTENNPNNQDHFKVLKKSYFTWVGGQDGVRGITFEISIDNSSIILDSLYYNNKVEKLKKDFSSTSNKFVASFVNTSKKNDFILSDNKTEEYGNKPPVSSKIVEVKVSYFYNKQKYYKVVSNLNQIENKNKFKN